MKCRALFTTLVLFVLSQSVFSQTLWKESKNPSWKTATGAEQYERLLWQAVKAKDWLAVESHIASNFIYQDASGTRDKQQRVADLKAATASAELTDVNVVANGIDAVVTYKMGSTRVMSVWQQQKSGWVLIAMSVSPAS
jgi:hypothetical protein